MQVASHRLNKCQKRNKVHLREVTQFADDIWKIALVIFTYNIGSWSKGREKWLIPHQLWILILHRHHNCFHLTIFLHRILTSKKMMNRFNKLMEAELGNLTYAKPYRMFLKCISICIVIICLRIILWKLLV